nr:hypothetical protein [Tanacetum cinerariifolium]
MRTRSSSNLVGESSPNTTTSNLKRRNRRRPKQPFSLEESPLDTMADQRTMEELLRAPTEGYAKAIVVPPILAEHFELKHSLINMMTSDQFFGLEKDNLHDHIPHRWLEKEPPCSILTWEDLVSKFINEFFPPSRTTNLQNEISNFQQRFDESFHEVWDHYKDLLRACPHHGFTELHQPDTFYNALNPADQDSLNSAAGGNLLERPTQDVLTIIENKSKVHNSRNKSIVSQVKSSNGNSSSSSEIAKLTHAVNQQTSVVTTAMTAILKQFQATPPPASVKAIEEIYVTYGGAHPYYQCLAADGNTFSEFQNNIQGYILATAINYNQGNSGYCPSSVANKFRPPGFAQPNVQNNQNRFSQLQGYNRGNNLNQDTSYQAPIQQNQVVSLSELEKIKKINKVNIKTMQAQINNVKNNLRNEISNFQQRLDESFHEAWDRYKDLLCACPHQGFTKLHQLDTFYNALNPADQDSLNYAAGGNLLERRTQDVLTIIENKSNVCNSLNKSIGSQVKSSDANSSSSSKVAKFTHAVNQETSVVTTTMIAILKQFQATPPPTFVKDVNEICVTCDGAHPYYQCLTADDITFIEFQDNIYGYVLATAINYNQGNFGYRTLSVANQIRPLGFAQPNVQNNQNQFSQPQGYNQGNNFNQDTSYQARIHQNQVVPLSKLEKIKKMNEINIKAMQTQINNVKNKLRNEMKTSIQAAMSNQTIELKNTMACFFQMNTASTSSSGTLPRNTIANPKGELKAITTQSGLLLNGPFVPMPPPLINPEEDKHAEETLTDPELADYNIKVPPPLVQKAKPPSQRNYAQEKDEIQIHKFWQMFKQLHINITLVDALILIPKYQKMLKALFSNKQKLLELANSSLNENCLAVILKKLPEKLRDPRKFLFLCGFSELKCKALADLGASINLMPLSIWKKVRDVFVLVGKFTFLANFVIVDCESDPRVLLILGRPFLRTALALIDVHGEEMILRDGDERLTLNMRHDTSSYSNQPHKESINMINIYNDSYEDYLKDMEIEYLLNHDLTKEIDSILEDSVNECNLTDPNKNLVDTIPEMFTDEHTLDYSSPPLYDDVDDDLVKLESDNDDVYDDPFDSKEDKINESKLLIDELDPPRSSDFLPSPECDSILYEDFSKVDALPSTNNEDKVFNLCILIHENLFEVTV